MKKLIALILTAVMLVGTLPAFAAETTDVSEAMPNSRVEVLSELGIIDGYAAAAQVTTYGLRDVIKRIFGNDALMTKFYGDVYKDKAVSLDNLLVVLLDALGYTDYANVKGGSYNAVSRYSAAKRIKLIEGSVNPNAKLTMELYVDILYNALFEVEMYEASTISTGKSGEEFIRYESGSTLGEVYLNLIRVSGIVNGVCGIDIKTGIDSEDAIIIGNTKYKYEKDYPDKYIGRYVDAFVDKDTKVIKAVRVAEEENKVWIFHSEDVSKDSGLSEFVYYNEKGKKKPIKLDNVDVVYNGNSFTRVTNSTFIQEDAVYTVIDNDGDNKAEVVLIDVYDVKRAHLFSKGTGATFITCVDGSYYDFEEFYEDGRYIEKADGTELEWDEIAKNDILLIRRDTLPGEAQPEGAIADFNRVIWSMDKVNGTLEYIEADFEKITVDGVEYKLTSSLRKDTAKLNNIECRDEVTCYMDAFGRVSDIDVYKSVEKVAAVIGLDEEGSGLSHKVLIKCITEDNEIIVYSFKNEFVLDGKVVSSEKLLEPTSTHRSKFMSGDKVVEQLIKIKANGKNEVVSITTASGFSNDDFYVTGSYPNSVYGSFGYTVFNGRFIADSKTKTFTVWPDEDLFTNCTETGSFNSTTYTLYNVDEETNRIGYVLIPYATLEGRSNEELYSSVGAAYMVLHSGLTIDDRTGEEVPYLYCWNNDRTIKLISQDKDLIPTTHESDSLALQAAKTGASNLLYIHLRDIVGYTENGWKKRKFNELKPGTLINLKIVDGYVTTFDVMFAPDYVEEDIKNGTWNNPPFEGVPPYSNNNTFGLSKDKFKQALIYAYGEVQRMTPYGPVVNSHLPTNAEIKEVLPAGTTLTGQMAIDMLNGKGEQIFPVKEWERLYTLDATVNVWFYDMENNKLTKGDFSNMVPGDRVFSVHNEYGNRLLIVYRVGE